ncbi:MAG: hypothetical protein JRH06_10165 [Deltaproteobacteria bacterium]|nr:hypothetical protein [Deltaproteobacteria bacterium]
MTWRAYEVILRLRSPLHIGCRKMGNLQRTHPYVTGRVLWGALTMRLTRDAFQGHGPATDSSKYRKIGDEVHQYLAFTYFYPTLRSGNDYRVAWPWENESNFRWRFLGSYQGTALSHPQQSAAEGMLHEVEFVSPNTLDTGETVFLKGYVFEKKGCILNWRLALKRLQMGGERGYGWGDLELVSTLPSSDGRLFGEVATFRGDGDIPVIQVSSGGHLLAHTFAADLPVVGDVEPLVGREWRSDEALRRYAGQYIAFCDVCFIPGGVTLQALDFAVNKYGIWEKRATGIGTSG